MLNLLTSEQIRLADNYTVESQQKSSVDLMESAAHAFVNAFKEDCPDKQVSIAIYCGTGNNGGDGLAIARLLRKDGYSNLRVKIAFFNPKSSPDFDINFDRLIASHAEYEKIQPDQLQTENAEIIIDALLGSGLNKPLSGKWAILVNHLNQQQKKIIAVDIPTGFCSQGEVNSASVILKAALTITFQLPKINFFFPESAAAQDRFKIVSIGLDDDFIESLASDFKLLEERDIQAILKPRKAFSHKGTYGHALVVAGAPETMGAALLCADACLHTGAGLTTACIPSQGLTAINVRSPEVMALLRHKILETPELSKYTALAAGPGLGTDADAKDLVNYLIQSKKPMVLDADALNIVSENPDLLNSLPENTVITPHLKEFDRLFGSHNNWWKRIQTAKKQANYLKIIIILKNRYSLIITPQQIFINPTGSPAMATGGMGDVLTGMIVSFLAQGYTAGESAVLSTYIHGLCGEKSKGHVYPASELIKAIPEVVKSLMI